MNPLSVKERGFSLCIQDSEPSYENEILNKYELKDRVNPSKSSMHVSALGLSLLPHLLQVTVEDNFISPVSQDANCSLKIKRCGNDYAEFLIKRALKPFISGIFKSSKSTEVSSETLVLRSFRKLSSKIVSGFFGSAIE